MKGSIADCAKDSRWKLHILVPQAALFSLARTPQQNRFLPAVYWLLYNAKKQTTLWPLYTHTHLWLTDQSQKTTLHVPELEWYGVGRCVVE